MEELPKENIWNVPNALTFCRVIIAFITIFLVFAGFNIIYIVVAFSIGMLTDFFDGQIARRFNLKTEFGRKFDVMADRILMAGVALAVVIQFSAVGLLTRNQIFQIFLILSREIFTFPIIFMALVLGKGVPIPQTRFIGKLTTFIQAFAFPTILLGSFSKLFGSISIYLAIITFLLGSIAAFYYTRDIKKLIAK